MRRVTLALFLVTLTAAPVAHSQAAARQKCGSQNQPGRITQVGLAIDCFSGAYHGTGFTPPMEDTLSFRRVSTETLQASALWSDWVSDSKAVRGSTPCSNANAILYTGSFTFYGGGVFIACSQRRPYLVYGFFRLKHTHTTVDGGTLAKLTQGVFLGTADWDNVVSFVFSDSHHKQFGVPEVVLGRNPY